MSAPTPLNVLHVSTYAGFRGGEIQLLNLCNELRRMGVAQGFLVREDKPFAQKLKQEGFSENLHTYARPGILRMAEARAIAHTALKGGYTLIHLNDAHAQGSAVTAASLGWIEVPMVLSRRVIFAPSRSPLTRYKYNHPGIRRILCVAGAVREALLSTVRDPNRLAVVPAGVDLKRFAGGKQGLLRDAAGVPAGRLLVGNVAAISPEKDYPTFVRAAGELVQQHKIDAQFIILGGDGGSEAEVRQLVQQLGLTERFSFLGFRPDLNLLIPDLDLLLFPSLSEGLPTAVQEAFAANVPVVSTPAGGLKEMVFDGETGFLAAPGDFKKMAERAAQVLNDPGLANRLRANAMTLLREKYTLEKMAEGMLAQFQEVVNTWGGHRMPKI